MTIYHWQRLLKGDLGNGHHLKRVSLYRDGEPLLDKKLPSRISYLKSNGVNNISIATNVSLLNEKNSEKLLSSGLDLIIMSIDSLDKKVFENIRVILKFEEVIDNAITFFKLRDKMNSKCRVWMRMIRQEENKDEWNDYHKFWLKYSKPIDRIYYHNIFNWGVQLKASFK